MTKVINFKPKNTINTVLTYKKVSYVELVQYIQDYLEKDLIENTLVESACQFNEQGPCPTEYDNNRTYISWFGDNPKNLKEICKIAYIEIISETEMRCMILNERPDKSEIIDVNT